MKKFIANILKVFGFLFFLLNAVILTVVIILTAASCIGAGSLTLSSEWIFVIFPICGMLAGWWLRRGRYGILRTLIITVSLLFAAGILFIAVYISPIIEKTHHEKTANSESNTPNV